MIYRMKHPENTRPSRRSPILRDPIRLARRARARALQDYFLNTWVQTMSLRKAMSISGVSWHQIQAWRRWNREFRFLYDSAKEFSETIRKEDHEEKVWQKAIYGNSGRAMEILLPPLLVSTSLSAMRRENMKFTTQGSRFNVLTSPVPNAASGAPQSRRNRFSASPRLRAGPEPWSRNFAAQRLQPLQLEIRGWKVGCNLVAIYLLKCALSCPKMKNARRGKMSYKH